MVIYRVYSFNSANIVLLMSFLFTQLIFSQQLNNQVINDSLYGQSFEELRSRLDRALNIENQDLYDVYCIYNLKKAKAENNNLEIARAYYNFITWDNFEQDILYSDSIILVAKDINHKAYPTSGYLTKANLYYDNSNYENALENFIIAHQWAKKKQDKILQFDAINGIAAIKNIWGLHEEALDIYRENFEDILAIPDYINSRYKDYIILATNFSYSLIRNNKLDSARVISQVAMEKAYGYKDDIAFYDLNKVHATANFYLKNYTHAKDSLLKYMVHYSDFDKADSHYMLGKIYQAQHQEESTIKHFKKVDSLYKIIKEPFPELKTVYNELFLYSKRFDDKNAQLYYLDQLISVDSVLDINYRNINKKVRLEFDIPNLKREKKELLVKLNKKKKPNYDI